MRRPTRSGGGCLALEPAAQLVEHAAGAVLAQLRVVEAIEEGAVFRVGQLGAGAAVGRAKLDRREGHRHERAAERQVVGERDPLVGDDVVEAGLVRGGGAGLHSVPLVAAYTEIRVEAHRGVVGAAAEPAGLQVGVGPGGEDTRSWPVVRALDREGRVDDGSFGHRGLLRGQSGCSARTAPSRSRRRSQVVRRSWIQRPATDSARLSIWQVRTRPTFSDRTSPLASSTATCWRTAGSDIANGCASWLTYAGPGPSRSPIARRVGSERAWNTRSSCGCGLSIC